MRHGIAGIDRQCTADQCRGLVPRAGLGSGDAAEMQSIKMPGIKFQDFAVQRQRFGRRAALVRSPRRLEFDLGRLGHARNNRLRSA